MTEYLTASAGPGATLERRCTGAALQVVALVVALALAFGAQSAWAEREYIFKSVDADGLIFSVQVGDTQGLYRWHLGALGTFDARLLGTAVRLEGEAAKGWVRPTTDGEATFEVGGSTGVLQRESLGFGCYSATLMHAGKSPLASVGTFIFKDMTPDGQLWSVRLTAVKGTYTWYAGEIGKVEARISGTKIELRGDGGTATVRTNSSGEVELAQGSPSVPEVLQPGSVGYGCYEATLRHFGTWVEPKSASSYLFSTTSPQGDIWSVAFGGSRGRYTWHMGGMGKVVATVSGTKITFVGDAAGSLDVDARRGLVLTTKDGDAAFQAGSLVFGCYEATLRHHGTWREGLGEQEFVFREASPDGQFWSVRRGGRAGVYVWYLGPMGEANATVVGTSVTLSSPTLRGSVRRADDGGDVTMEVGGETLVLQPGSVGFGCWEATLRDAGTWREDLRPRPYVWQDAGLDGSLWAVRATATAGRYTWLMGPLGRATATVTGKSIRVVSSVGTSTLSPDAAGDLFVTEEGVRTLMPSGSLVAEAYEATMAHALRAK